MNYQAVPQIKRKSHSENETPTNVPISKAFNKNDYIFANDTHTSLTFEFNNDDNICALENVIEYVNESSNESKYECLSCNMIFDDGHKITNHLKEAAHFSKYIRTRPNNNTILVQEFRYILCCTLKQYYEKATNKSWLNQIAVKSRMLGLSTNPNIFVKNEYVLIKNGQTLMCLGPETDFICGLQYVVEYRMTGKRLKYECNLCNCITDSAITMLSHLKGIKHFSNIFQKEIEKNDANIIDNADFKALFCKNLKIRIEDVSKKSWLYLVKVKIQKKLQKQPENPCKKMKCNSKPIKQITNNTINSSELKLQQLNQQQILPVIPVKIEPYADSLFYNVYNYNKNMNFKEKITEHTEAESSQYEQSMNDIFEDISLIQMYPKIRFMFNTANLVRNKQDLQMAEALLKKLNNDITLIAN